MALGALAWAHAWPQHHSSPAGQRRQARAGASARRCLRDRPSFLSAGTRAAQVPAEMQLLRGASAGGAEQHPSAWGRPPVCRSPVTVLVRNIPYAWAVPGLSSSPVLSAADGTVAS